MAPPSPPEATLVAPREAEDTTPDNADNGLRAHLRSCSQAQGALARAQQALHWLHGLTAPRLVSVWLLVLLLATLAALAF